MSDQLWSTRGMSAARIVEAVGAGRFDDFLAAELDPTLLTTADRLLRALGPERLAAEIAAGTLEALIKQWAWAPG